MFAISGDTPEDSAALRERLNIELPLYSDKGGVAATKYQVFDAEAGFSRVASFIVAPGGKVIFRYVGANKKDRPSVADYIKVIEAHAKATR